MTCRDIARDAVMLPDVADLTDVLADLKAEGYEFTREQVARLSPYMTARLKRSGQQVLDPGGHHHHTCTRWPMAGRIRCTETPPLSPAPRTAMWGKLPQTRHSQLIGSWAAHAIGGSAVPVLGGSYIESPAATSNTVGPVCLRFAGVRMGFAYCL